MIAYVLQDVFTEIALLLLLSAVVGAIGLKLKQPLIVAFIAVGILVGPSALGWVQTNDQVDLLAKMGIALLLFLVGLKLDIHIIRSMGPVAVFAGLGQVLFTSVFGFLIALGLGLVVTAAVYVAVALTFSSTIIIVKLLSDKREIDQLHGRIAIGFLIVQDIVVILVMIALTALGESSGQTLGQQAITILVNGTLFLLGIAAMMRFVLTPLLRQLAKSSELLILFAIAWAVSLAALGVQLGFSKEVGAFLAGISIASTPYREVIGARLTSLRDFLLLFFFIDLGVGLDLSTLGAQVLPALLLSAFVLIGNPLIVMVILGTMGYRKRTSFLAGLTVAQISEFSLILAALGLSQGYISADTMGLITLVGLITISLSTYMIIYSEALYRYLSRWLSPFERHLPTQSLDEEGGNENASADAVIFGLGRIGTQLSEQFASNGCSVLGIDIDPQRIRQNRKTLIQAQFGDMGSPEFIAHLPLESTRFVIATTRELPDILAMISTLGDTGYQGEIVAFVDSDAEAEFLRDKGCHITFNAHRGAANLLFEQLNLPCLSSGSISSSDPTVKPPVSDS
ncbi:Iron transporter MagA [BD1-7 clade bacterium]|uniref:Iron transporter MagA n=1 Tax=BD1-7 clade bacterium TaxID=2029982 RepID=A0A5S9PN22_9GAMM|nr:Iron transporter MagA [BD1-7 clade bacterium]